jgi:hypothetical protein
MITGKAPNFDNGGSVEGSEWGKPKKLFCLILCLGGLSFYVIPCHNHIVFSKISGCMIPACDLEFQLTSTWK